MKLATAVPGCSGLINQTISAGDIANVPTWKARCSQILESAKVFQARVDTTRKSFNYVAAVWDKEHRAQADIVATSNANTNQQ